MLYVKEITTPAATSRLAPKKTNIKVWGGIIVKIEIMFPPGPQGDLKVAIYHGGHPVSPVNVGSWFAADDETVSFREFYPLRSAENTLTVYTYNDDAVNPHMCRVRINVLPRDIADPRRAQRRLAGRLQTLLRRIGAV